MKTHLRSFFLLLLLMFAVTTVFGQTTRGKYTVKGKLIDKTSGEPIIGASIKVKDENRGTVTDVDGNFSIELSEEDAALILSSVGYLPEEITVTPETQPLQIELEQDIANLEEVVVTGLASSVKRSNLANAVSTVSGAELMGTTVPQTLDGALYGKLPGINITSNSGAPGGGVSIKLRGITTINGTSEPLYIVDGVYMNNASFSAGTNSATIADTDGEITSPQDNPSNRIADINPEDIESVEVLKGPSTSAIYGTRANAGVIIIKTKRGQPGKTKITLSQDVGGTSILNKLGTRTFTEENVAAELPSQLDAFTEALDNGRLVDYEEELYGETGLLLRTHLSLSGGNENTRFYLSGLWQDEEGIIKGTGYERKSMRANIEHNFNKDIKIGLNLNYLNTKADRTVTNNDNAGVSVGISLVNTYPWADLFPNENGVYPDNPFASSNFLQTRDLSEVEEQTDRFIIGLNLDFNLLVRKRSSLKFIVYGGLDIINHDSKAYFPETLQWQQSGLTATNGFFARGNNSNTNFNGTVALLHNLTTDNGAFNFNTQLGANRFEVDQMRNIVTATDLIGGQKNLEQAGAINVFDRILETTDIGYFAQEEVNWKDRVILTAGVRLDKTSLNGDPDEIFFYPKASAAVNVANFDFFDKDLFNQVKIRAAYGEAGGVPSANSVTLRQPAFTIFNGSNISSNAGSLISEIQGNEDIQPERAKEFEAGIDLGILNNRVYLEATWYNKKVEDLILQADVPQSSGFEDKFINGGELRNRGVEITLGAAPLQKTNVTWDTRFIFWRNRSKILSLDVPSFDAPNGGFSSFLGIYRVEEGSSATQIVGPVPGSDGDVKIGDAEPDFQLSWYNTVTFLKNFQFNMLWHWKKGGDNINLTNLLADFAGTTHDFDDDDNGNGIANGPERIQAFIDRDNATVFIEDAGYLKLREISLFYKIPLQREWLDYIRLGVSGYNLVMFTDYNSYDPEVSNFGNNGISTGVEVAPFPSSRRYFFHVQLGI
ncbi:SusC/RagA family TonB-linked outer membrane protein [Limibacter armeniacum]|uniref:SusC/RagA family TonB-linked outer membrane protein n=1 Tax=Limibacter armeniacum TaxID=466084 RepID=UPI002FE5E9E9